MSTENQSIEERIYIGNVDYKADEDELKQFFEGLKVVDVNIPSKPYWRNKKLFQRHLGFAFVQLETKDDANKAIEEFNGKDFKGRAIYVKRAVPPPTEEEKQEKIKAFKAKQVEKKELKEAAKKEEEAKEVKEDTETVTGETLNGSASTPSSKKKKAKKPLASNGTKFKKEKVAIEMDEAKATPEEVTTATKEVSKEKIPDGEPSKDTIFITNLDYKASVKTLNGLFKELKPKWIHVPTRKVPYHILKRQKKRGNVIYNKGIAFIKFSSEELQKKAVSEFNGKEINGRQIIVDIAIDARIPKSDEDSSEKQDESEKKQDSQPEEKS